jgi:hypothetical protein
MLLIFGWGGAAVFHREIKTHVIQTEIRTPAPTQYKGSTLVLK